MKHLTDTYLWEQITRDAVEHRTMQRIYYEAGYRAGVRDAEHKDQQKNGYSDR
jgi:hypothetical protein